LIHGRRYRKRSIENVVEEMKVIYEKFHIKEVVFVDDNFTVDIKYTRKLCERLIEENMDMVWCIETGVRNITVDLLTLMKN